MILYTYQLAHHRRLMKGDIPLLDTTVKTGDKRLAPNWDIVMGVKNGTITEAQYTTEYLAILNQSWNDHPDFFKWLYSHEVLAVGCYCRAGVFCHRHLLVSFLKERGKDVRYFGEISQVL